MIFFKHHCFFKEGKWCQHRGVRPNIRIKLLKLNLVLKLALLVVSITCFKVSAMVSAQGINLVLNDVPLEMAFSEIKKQTGYGFWYDKADLNQTTKISITIKNGSLKETLDQCFKTQPLVYEIFDKTIVVKYKERNVGNKIIDFIKSRIIKGKVTDENGVPMAGVTVRLKGTEKISITKVDGEFAIEVPDENTVLQFTYLGFASFEQLTKGDQFLNIVLKEEQSALRTVEINAGYYTVKERERTGSISSVSAETIGKQAINNPLQALQGRIPGLEVTQLTGIPGGGFTVQIRGQNSIRSGNDPLYIVDGVVYPSSRLTGANSIIQENASPLIMINPSDIESIEVLKDADATAIYGSRGSNGVILINTKKAVPGDLRIDVVINQGYGQAGSLRKMMNTSQYLAMRMEALKNSGIEPSATDYDINGAWDKNKYTDWQNLLIGGQANTGNASLNISGGTANSNYLLSGNYYNEGTVFSGDFGFGLKRGGVHTSLSFGSAKSRFQANFNGTYSRAQSLLPVTEPSTDVLRSPNAPDPYDEAGQLQWYYRGLPVASNPMARLLNTVKGIADNLIGNTTLSYRVLNNLILKTSFSYNILRKEELKKSTNAARNPATNPTSIQRTSEFGNIANNTWTLEPQLSYDSKLGNGKLSALMGMSFQQDISEFRNIVANNFANDEVMENISSATTFSVNDVSYTKYKYAALFARLNYSLLDRYYLNLTTRRDGSSRFGPGKQFANFGAVGIAWTFSEESLIRNKLPFLSFGKLRASYGITGNDQIGNYLYMDLYNGSSSYQGMPTISSTGIRNPDYAWETNKKAEAAIQLGFLKDRLNFQVAYFRNHSSNQLLRSLLPPSVGSSAIIANLPALVQNTGWEIESTLKWVSQKNWTWQTDFNISFPKNKLLAYPGLETSADAVSLIIGQPLAIDRYTNIVVDRQTGLYVTEDFNQNGQIDIGDRYLNKFIGQVFYGGLQNSINYKQFNLDFLISFNKRNGSNPIFDGSIPGIFSGSSPTFNKIVSVLDGRWQKPGDVTLTSKFSNSTASNANNTQSRTSIRNVNEILYARLRNASLSYSLPKTWLSKIKIKDCQLTAQGQNLFLWTNYEGGDPEAGNKTPPLRVLMFGLKVTL